jgi:hypothetical protein
MSLISLGSSRNLKVPFLSYVGRRVDFASVVGGLAVRFPLGAILTIGLLVIVVVVWSIVVPVV